MEKYKIFKCSCGRKFKRKCDYSKHIKTCGKIFLFYGYEAFLGIDGQEKFVHRKTMEKKLGRKLKSHEIVHHKDENKLNNNLNNLELNSIGLIKLKKKKKRLKEKLVYQKLTNQLDKNLIKKKLKKLENEFYMVKNKHFLLMSMVLVNIR